MMIYIDDDFRCHVTNPDGAYTAVETKFFDGKCPAYIEGFRFVPVGETWTRSDGEVFTGEMTAAWQDWREMDKAQRDYERELLAEYEAALSEIEAALGVSG